MPWHSVFISHSSKSDESRKYLQAVRDALDGKVNVFLDEEGLSGGDYWREKIYDWMDKAHGAVLLLTSDALKSDFIPIEASVLSWRSFRQREFVFVPILINVNKDDLESGVIGKLFLNEIQMIQTDDPDIVAGKVVESLKKLIEKEKPRTRTLRQLLEANIVRDLKDSAISEMVLHEVGGNYLSIWTGQAKDEDFSLYETFAHCILNAKIEEAYRTILSLADTYKMQNATDLFYLITPCWVVEEYAKPIAKLALDCFFENRAVSLNSSDRWTIDSYISRSYFKPYNHGLTVCEITQPLDDSDPMAEIERQVLSFFAPRKSAPGGKDPAAIKRRIARHHELGMPVFFLFQWIPDPELFQQLREEFKTVTFFIATDDTNSLLTRLNKIRERVCELSLDKNSEQNAMDAYIIFGDKLEELSQKDRG